MNGATWAWILIPFYIAAYVVGFDVWAMVTHHQTMSGQIHVWMQSQLAGPIVVGLWFGASIGLMYHFLINR